MSRTSTRSRASREEDESDLSDTASEAEAESLRVYLVFKDRPGSLGAISLAFAHLDINILEASVFCTADGERPSPALTTPRARARHRVSPASSPASVSGFAIDTFSLEMRQDSHRLSALAHSLKAAVGSYTPGVAAEPGIYTAVTASPRRDAELVGRMQYVYSYGIKMFQAGMITEEALKPIILDELCARVGMTGEELDQWLAMPAAK